MPASLLTPELISAVHDSVRKGTPIAAALSANGVSHDTLWMWRQIYDGAETWPNTRTRVSKRMRHSIQELFDGLPSARAEAVQVLVGSLWHNATTVNPKTGWFDTQAADKILSKGDSRGEWHEEKHLSVQHSGGVNHTLEAVRGLSDAELVDHLPAEWQALALPEGEVGRGAAGDEGER